MTKNEFLLRLREELNGLPDEDISRSIGYYSEIIDDSIEGGASEADTIDSLGSISEIAANILADLPPTESREVVTCEKVENEGAEDESETVPARKRSPKPWEITLLVLGSPLWISLAAALLSVVLSLYIVMWSVVVVLYAAAIALGAGAVAGVISAAAQLVHGEIASGLLAAGAALVCSGTGLLFFALANLTAKGVIFISKKTFFALKRAFVGKEAV